MWLISLLFFPIVQERQRHKFGRTTLHRPLYQRYKRTIDYDVQPKYYGDSGTIDLSLI